MQDSNSDSATGTFVVLLLTNKLVCSASVQQGCGNLIVIEFGGGLISKSDLRSFYRSS
jgi:hypothetical protein